MKSLDYQGIEVKKFSMSAVAGPRQGEPDVKIKAENWGSTARLAEQCCPGRIESADSVGQRCTEPGFNC